MRFAIRCLLFEAGLAVFEGGGCMLYVIHECFLKRGSSFFEEGVVCYM